MRSQGRGSGSATGDGDDRLPLLRPREPGRVRLLPGLRHEARGGRRTPALTEERKVVSTLFCDLVSYTAHSEAADHELIDALLQRYNALAQEARRGPRRRRREVHRRRRARRLRLPANPRRRRRTRRALRPQARLETAALAWPDGDPVPGADRRQHRRDLPAHRRRPAIRRDLPHRRRREHRRPARDRRPARRRRRRRADALAHRQGHRLRGAPSTHPQGQGRARACAGGPGRFAAAPACAPRRSSTPRSSVASGAHRPAGRP